MKDFLEILKYTIPSIIVFFTAYFLIKDFLKNDSKKRIAELENAQKERLLGIKSEAQKIITPIRLQAYERVVMLLERTSPNHLILRINRPEMSAAQLQKAMIKTIHDEFDHNLSQQVYISSQAWELVKNAKEETIKLINVSAEKVNKDANGTDLARVIFKEIIEKKESSINIALKYVKKEIRQTFYMNN